MVPWIAVAVIFIRRKETANMEVSGWKNGKFGFGRVGLGIRIGKKNAGQYFDRKWNGVLIELDETAVLLKIPASFWRKCPELRNPAITDWMTAKGLVPWPKGIPPKMTLIPTGENRFRLTR